jgi:hypothetical protein
MPGELLGLGESFANLDNVVDGLFAKHANSHGVFAEQDFRPWDLGDAHFFAAYLRRSFLTLYGPV